MSTESSVEMEVFGSTKQSSLIGYRYGIEYVYMCRRLSLGLQILPVLRVFSILTTQPAFSLVGASHSGLESCTQKHGYNLAGLPAPA